MTSFSNKETQTDNTKSKTRFQGKNYFLTYSDCGFDSLKFALEREIIERFKDHQLSLYVISEETHVNGSFHYHVLLRFSKRKVFGLRTFDFFGIHPNIQIVRSMVNSLSYIVKQDKKPLVSSNFINYVCSNKTLLRSVLHILFELNFVPQDLFLINPVLTENAMNYHRRYSEWCSTDFYKFLVQKQGFKLELFDFPNKAYEIILLKLKELEEYCKTFKRPRKTKNLYIWSAKPDLGKTRFVDILKEYVRDFPFPIDNWFDGYRNHFFHIINFQEFRLVGMPFEHMLLLLEGETVTLPIKGSHIPKRDNPLIITTHNSPLIYHIKNKFSNASSEEIEKKVKILEARLISIEIGDDFHNFLDMLEKHLSSSLCAQRSKEL